MKYWMIFLSFLNVFILFFFFNDTATTEIYTLSLHDALPICILHSIVLEHFGLVDMWVYDIQADDHRDLLPRSSVKHSHEAELRRLLYAEVLHKQVLRDFGSVG